MDAEDKKTTRDESRSLLHELGQNPYRLCSVVFALVSIIPLLVFAYVLAVELSTLDVFIGDIGLQLLLLIFIGLIGYFIAYGVMRRMLDKIILYAARAKRSDEQKSTFVAMVAHELKSPLAVIQTNMSNLQSGFHGQINEEQKNILGLSAQVIDRMDRLVCDLLDIYKIEAGMAALEKTRCDLARLVKRQLEELKVMFSEKHIELIRDIPDEDLVIWADEEKVMVVVNNLLWNAVKYTPEGGRVAVRARKADEFARIEVANTGHGILKDKLERIFDKFEKLDTTKEGIGLGLAIAKDIVELHRGRIWAESTPGKESRFIVLLPQGNGEGEEDVRGREKEDTHNR